MTVNKYKLALEILEYFSKQPNGKYVLKANVIGLQSQEGKFGKHFNRVLTNKERSLLDIVIQELQEKNLIQPAYQDTMSRGEDLIITDKGKRALQERILDELDELLLSLKSKSDLISMRYGAYDAVMNKQTDWERQAATSLVELINHTLRTIAPNTSVKKQEWYSPDKNLKTGITRKQRVRYFLELKNGSRSKVVEKVVIKAWELIKSCRAKLESIKHTQDKNKEVEQLIKLVEDALLFLLKR